MSPTPKHEYAASIFDAEESISCWDWTCRNTDFSLCPSYRAATPGRYNPALMPWWKTPLDAIVDRKWREVVILAMEQCGKTEHCACIPLRYWIGTGANLAVLYVGGAEEKSQQVFEERIVRGFRCTPQTAAMAEKATRRGLVYEIGNSVIVCGWAKGRDTFKSRPFDVVICDEVSSWDDIARVDQARKRGSTRPFFKLIIFSSPDPEQHRPSEQDPIFHEFSESTAHEYAIPEPNGKGDFVFDTGEQGDGPGLKWSADAKHDGKWNLREVEESAFYRTPGGAVLREENRWPLITQGQWKETNPNPTPRKIGFHFGSFLLPWKTEGGFGVLAARKVQAVSRGPESHRVYRYNTEARPWIGQADSIEDKMLAKCAGNYPRGTLLTDVPMYAERYRNKATLLLLTVDVQHFVFWWRLRLWFEGGDSAGVDYGVIHTWTELAALADEWGKRGINLFVLIDSGDGQRAIEIGEACQKYNFIACKGASMRIKGVQKWQFKEAWNYRQGGTGKATDGYFCPLLLHDPHSLKDDMFSRISGASGYKWFVEDGLGPDYVMHMAAQEKNEVGLWKPKPGRKDDHLLDCEELQMLGAAWQGFAVSVSEEELKSEVTN